VAKALSGGFVPVGGVLVSAAVRDHVFSSMERGVRHGSTFGGNDMAAAAGLATIGVIEREGLVDRAARMGELLFGLTRPLVDRYEIVRDVRGLGLMWAIELGTPSSLRRRAVWSMVERAHAGLAAQLLVVPLFQRHRVFCQVAGHRMNVVKALPALVVEESEIYRFAAALEEVVADADRMGRAVGRLGWDLARGSARALRR
jgi:ornithine--oxo-acid transaminase